MSRPPTTDTRLTAWLEEGPSTGPDDGLSDALARARSTGQRPGWLVTLRGGTMETTWRARPVLTARLTFALLITMLVLALVGSAVLIGTRLTTHLALVPAIPRGGAAVLAYSDRTDGQLDIYTIRADGTDRLRITTDPADETYPVFSPDGSAIAYFVPSSEPRAPGLLRVIDSNGVHRDVATDLGCGLEDGWPAAWSPDGRFLIYPIDNGACDDESADLQIVAANGGSPSRRLLSAAVVGASIGADWSPDGTQIAFQHFEGGSTSLWVADVTDVASPFDLGARRISPADITSYHKGSWQGPQWSPDGTMMATLVAPAAAEIITDVVVVIADGSRLWRPLPIDLGTGDEVDPGWYPDSEKLATGVLADPTGSNADGYTVLQVAVGDDLTEPLAAPLRSAPSVSGWVRPHVSPDGSHLAYRLPSTTSDGEPGDLYLRNLSFLNGGGEVTIVAAGPSEPDWQPWVAPLPPGQPIP